MKVINGYGCRKVFKRCQDYYEHDTRVTTNDYYENTNYNSGNYYTNASDEDTYPQYGKMSFKEKKHVVSSKKSYENSDEDYDIDGRSCIYNQKDVTKIYDYSDEQDDKIVDSYRKSKCINGS